MESQSTTFRKVCSPGDRLKLKYPPWVLDKWVSQTHLMLAWVKMHFLILSRLMFPQSGAFLREVSDSCPLGSVAAFLMHMVSPNAGAVMVQECEEV